MGKTFKDRRKREKEKYCLHCLSYLNKQLERERQEYIFSGKQGKIPKFKFN